MPLKYETMVEAQQGNSLVLTIDEYIQYCAEKYLDAAVIGNNCTNRGCVIVMDIKTGGILAMATKPDFDPNEPFILADPAAQARVDALEGEARTKQLSLSVSSSGETRRCRTPTNPVRFLRWSPVRPRSEESVVFSQLDL